MKERNDYVREYTKLYMRFHDKYMKKDGLDYNKCFYCGDETSTCDHTPPIVILGRWGVFTEERTRAKGNVYRTWHLPPLIGPDRELVTGELLELSENLYPFLIPACRPCLGLLQREHQALTPATRKAVVIRKMLSRTGWKGLSRIGDKKEDQVQKTKSLGDILKENLRKRI